MAIAWPEVARHRYTNGDPVDKIARDLAVTWAQAADACGHVWLRPKHIDERGFSIAEDETWQVSPTVVGL